MAKALVTATRFQTLSSIQNSTSKSSSNNNQDLNSLTRCGSDQTEGNSRYMLGMTTPESMFARMGRKVPNKAMPKPRRSIPRPNFHSVMTPSTGPTNPSNWDVLIMNNMGTPYENSNEGSRSNSGETKARP